MEILNAVEVMTDDADVIYLKLYQRKRKLNLTNTRSRMRFPWPLAKNPSLRLLICLGSFCCILDQLQVRRGDWKMTLVHLRSQLDLWAVWRACFSYTAIKQHVHQRLKHKGEQKISSQVQLCALILLGAHKTHEFSLVMFHGNSSHPSV